MSSVVINSASQINPLTGASAQQAGVTSFSALTDKASADLPGTNAPLSAALAAKAPALVTTDLGTNYTLTAADNGKAFNITANITVTAPSGLSPRPEVLFTAPPTGVFTLAPTGGTMLNNAAASMTFSRDTNPAGVVMRPYSEYDGYGVSASSGGGSGGSTTFAALADKTTVDLPAINTPLANALNPTPASISSMTALAATDNGKIYSCSAAFSTNVPNGLTPKPSTIFFPPATGNLTLTPTGGATLNGSASPITRAFTGTNKLGVALIPNPYDVSDYSVSGS